MDTDGDALVAFAQGGNDYGTLLDELAHVAEQKKALIAKIAKLERLDDEELDEANRQLDSIWIKTHCFGRHSALVFLVPLTTLVLGVYTALVGFVYAIGFPPGLGVWIGFLALSWLALGLVGLIHLPICAFHGDCGCCRQCPCSK